MQAKTEDPGIKISKHGDAILLFTCLPTQCPVQFLWSKTVECLPYCQGCMKGYTYICTYSSCFVLDNISIARIRELMCMYIPMYIHMYVCMSDSNCEGDDVFYSVVLMSLIYSKSRRVSSHYSILRPYLTCHILRSTEYEATAEL
jgi:hypothetical protein